MREAAEARDHVAMAARVIEVDLARLAFDRGRQRDRALLVGHRFGMLERHVEERAQRRIDLKSSPRSIARPA